MAPRASWKGFLRISLVTCPIALYPATSSSERISFNRINKATGQRVRQLNVDGKSGQKVEADEIVKGFEVDKGRYVLIEDEEIEAIQIEATKIINVTQFVDQAEVDPFYIDTPYYMAPEGTIPEETYRVVRAAMEETGTAGIGTIVLANRERPVLISAEGQGPRHDDAEDRPRGAQLRGLFRECRRRRLRPGASRHGEAPYPGAQEAVPAGGIRRPLRGGAAQPRSVEDEGRDARLRSRAVAPPR